MSSDTPRTDGETLTEAERLMGARVEGHVWFTEKQVERILADRAVSTVQADDGLRALADKWDAELRREFRLGESAMDWTDKHADDLRAVLDASPAPDGER